MLNRPEVLLLGYPLLLDLKTPLQFHALNPAAVNAEEVVMVIVFHDLISLPAVPDVQLTKHILRHQEIDLTVHSCLVNIDIHSLKKSHHFNHAEWSS